MSDVERAALKKGPTMSDYDLSERGLDAMVRNRALTDDISLGLARTQIEDFKSSLAAYHKIAVAEAVEAERARLHDAVTAMPESGTFGRVRKVEVLALLEPPKPAPTFRVGDVVTMNDDKNGKLVGTVVAFNDRGEAKKLKPIHPGEILREEFMVPRNLTANTLAIALQVPATRIGDILRGKRAITAETALRLGRYFGTSPQLWTGMQAQYDLEITEDKIGSQVQREIRAALEEVQP